MFLSNFGQLLYNLKGTDTQTPDIIGLSFGYWEKILMARCSILCRRGFFLFHNVQTDSGADPSFYSLSTRGETTRAEADHLLLRSAKVNNWRKFSSALLYALMVYTGTISPLYLPKNYMPQILAVITELILIRQDLKSLVFYIRKAATFFSAILGEKIVQWSTKTHLSDSKWHSAGFLGQRARISLEVSMLVWRTLSWIFWK